MADKKRNYVGAVVEERFEYKGYPCVVVMQALCFRTGYVALEKGSKFYCVPYADIPVRCHGGLTYGSEKLIGQTDTDVFWIGYDTGHYGDGYDYESGMRLFADYKENIEFINMHINDPLFCDCFDFRSLSYCKRECEKIVDQLIEMGDESWQKN